MAPRDPVPAAPVGLASPPESLRRATVGSGVVGGRLARVASTDRRPAVFRGTSFAGGAAAARSRGPEGVRRLGGVRTGGGSGGGRRLRRAAEEWRVAEAPARRGPAAPELGGSRAIGGRGVSRRSDWRRGRHGVRSLRLQPGHGRKADLRVVRGPGSKTSSTTSAGQPSGGQDCSISSTWADPQSSFWTAQIDSDCVNNFHRARPGGVRHRFELQVQDPDRVASGHHRRR